MDRLNSNSTFSETLFTLIVFILLTICFLFELSLVLLTVAAFSITFIIIQYYEFDIKDELVVSAILVLTFIGPLIEIFPGLPSFRPEQFLVFSILPLLVFIKDKKPNEPIFLLLKWLLLFQSIQMFSLFWGYLVLDVNSGIKDIIEIIRVFSYGLTIYAIGKMKFDQTVFRKLLLLILALFIISSIIGLLQYFSIAGFDRITAPLYFPGRIHDVNNRMMGTFVNPNTYGSFVSFGAILALGLALNERNKKIKAFSIIGFFILTATLLLTTSRTALISFIVGLASLIILFGISKGLKWYKILFIFIIISIFSFVIGFLLAGEIWARLKTVLNIMDDLSWQMRLFAWYVNIELFLISPIFGWGPTFHQFTPTVDSDYILILRRYGVVGFTVYLSFYIVPIYHSAKYLISNSFNSTISQILIASSVAFLVGNIPNSLFHEMQLMSYWSVFIGLCLSSFSLRNKRLIEAY